MVHESVRWLAERGEAKKCVEILKKIARTNGKEVKAEIYDSYEVHVFFGLNLRHSPTPLTLILLQKLVCKQYEIMKDAPVPKITDAFRTPRLRRIMLLIAFA